MTLQAPPLEGFIVVLQHKADVARRLETALSNAGATVFRTEYLIETDEMMKRYQAHLIVIDTHDRDGKPNDELSFAATLMSTGHILYSEPLSEPGLIGLSRWIGIDRPVADVVAEAIELRRLQKV